MGQIFSFYGLLALIAGYLLGSIPFGLVLTRAAGLGDVRSIGSGNIGATNVLRTGNKGLAAATLLLDALKRTQPPAELVRKEQNAERGKTSRKVWRVPDHDVANHLRRCGWNLGGTIYLGGRGEDEPSTEHNEAHRRDGPPDGVEPRSPLTRGRIGQCSHGCFFRREGAVQNRRQRVAVQTRAAA